MIMHYKPMAPLAAARPSLDLASILLIDNPVTHCPSISKMTGLDNEVSHGCLFAVPRR